MKFIMCLYCVQIIQMKIQQVCLWGLRDFIMKLRLVHFSIVEDTAWCQPTPISYPTRCAKTKGIVATANRHFGNRAPGVLDKDDTTNSPVLVI